MFSRTISRFFSICGILAAACVSAVVDTALKAVAVVATAALFVVDLTVKALAYAARGMPRLAPNRHDPEPTERAPEGRGHLRPHAGGAPQAERAAELPPLRQRLSPQARPPSPPPHLSTP